jgi:hypothetical protein
MFIPLKMVLIGIDPYPSDGEDVLGMGIYGTGWWFGTWLL